MLSFLGAPAVVMAAHRVGGFSRVECFIGERTSSQEADALAGARLSHDELENFDEEVEQTRTHLLNTPGEFNEVRISPVAAAVSADGVLSIRCRMTDYAEYLVARRWWSGLDATTRRARVEAGSGRVDPLLSAGIGVSLAAVTCDGLLVVSRRPASAAVWPDALQATVSEGSSLADAALGSNQSMTWDPRVTFSRGLVEELGVRVPVPVKISGLLTDLASGTVSLVGHTQLPLTFEEVLVTAAGAADADELVNLQGLPWDLARLNEWAGRASWAPWGSAAAVLALIDAGGWRPVGGAGLVAEIP